MPRKVSRLSYQVLLVTLGLGVGFPAHAQDRQHQLETELDLAQQFRDLAAKATGAEQASDVAWAEYHQCVADHLKPGASVGGTCTAPSELSGSVGGALNLFSTFKNWASETKADSAAKSAAMRQEATVLGSQATHYLIDGNFVQADTAFSRAAALEPENRTFLLGWTASLLRSDTGVAAYGPSHRLYLVAAGSDTALRLARVVFSRVLTNPATDSSRAYRMGWIAGQQYPTRSAVRLADGIGLSGLIVGGTATAILVHPHPSGMRLAWSVVGGGLGLLATSMTLGQLPLTDAATFPVGEGGLVSVSPKTVQIAYQFGFREGSRQSRGDALRAESLKGAEQGLVVTGTGLVTALLLKALVH